MDENNEIRRKLEAKGWAIKGPYLQDRGAGQGKIMLAIRSLSGNHEDVAITLPDAGALADGRATISDILKRIDERTKA
jgi:hypothetical protein